MSNVSKIPVLPENLLSLVPVFGPDPRQEMFLASLKPTSTLLANLNRGYAAACPDLTVLQWVTHAAVKHYDLNYKTAFKATVCVCVQRVETLLTKSLTDRGCYEVSFSANDDFGRYRYTYAIDLKIKSYPVPIIIKKQVEQLNQEGETL